MPRPRIYCPALTVFEIHPPIPSLHRRFFAFTHVTAELGRRFSSTRVGPGAIMDGVKAAPIRGGYPHAPSLQTDRRPPARRVLGRSSASCRLRPDGDPLGHVPPGACLSRCCRACSNMQWRYREPPVGAIWINPEDRLEHACAYHAGAFQVHGHGWSTAASSSDLTARGTHPGASSVIRPALVESRRHARSLSAYLTAIAASAVTSGSTAPLLDR